MIAGRVLPRVAGPPRDVVDALAAFPTGIVSDCLNRMGAMDGRVRALVPGRRFCGPAVTVEEVEGGNLMSHAALELVAPGDVLVIDAKGVTTRACFGGVQTLAAQRRGAAAVVAYGMVRDVEDLAALGLPVHALGTCPAGPLKGWGGNVNAPIACGGVVVRAGDLVLGDDDGVVVVPQELAAELPALCADRVAHEEGWTAAIEAGASTVDAVGLRSALEAQGIRYEA
jgi:4-hydroxy-4-methyl-2-oxoglutarate aldolase